MCEIQCPGPACPPLKAGLTDECSGRHRGIGSIAEIDIVFRKTRASNDTAAVENNRGAHNLTVTRTIIIIIYTSPKRY